MNQALLATRENGGCPRHYVRGRTGLGEEVSVVLIPKVAQTSLRAWGTFEHFPSCRVLAVLRDPVDRAWSAWQHLHEERGWPDWPQLLEDLAEYAQAKRMSVLDRHLRPQMWYLGRHRFVARTRYITIGEIHDVLGAGFHNARAPMPPDIYQEAAGALRGVYRDDQLLWEEVMRTAPPGTAEAVV